MKIREKDILVNLTHCKYSSESTPGARVEDLYDVCGQASKSMVWGEAFSKLIKNLIRREKNRQKNDLSGIIIGDESLLVALESMEKYKPQVYTVTIVQPGLSKAKISLQQKSLLACVETYLHETHEMKLEVIASR